MLEIIYLLLKLTYSQPDGHGIKLQLLNAKLNIKIQRHNKP